MAIAALTAAISATPGQANSSSALTREPRSIDGSGNNVFDPEMGGVDTQLQRMAPSDYDDTRASMRQTGANGAALKSAREISNLVVAQGKRSIVNRFGTTDWIWQWGQFIDHDLDLTDPLPATPQNVEPVAVPKGDPFFDPQGTGTATIAFTRSVFDPATGSRSSNPRQQLNQITGWIDASNVYGSSEDRAQALRRRDGSGELKTNDRGLLPFNTDNLPNANGPAPDPTKLFVAGDLRANEQVGLAAIHTLFVREHNRLARRIKAQNPQMTEEEIYQKARKLVGAEMQMITYNEFLPALLGSDAIAPYKGYNPRTDASIRNEFSVAAYRFGHSSLSPRILRLNARGQEAPGGHLALRDAFFNAPNLLKNQENLAEIYRGLARQPHQQIDGMIVDDLRNFLFGPPGAGGFDLASLNIQRGRDHGVSSYNDVREALGLSRHRSFDQITRNPAARARLSRAYASVDDVDLWVGGLAEDPAGKSQLGELFTTIIAQQFTALRDGDRFWYQTYLTRDERRLLGEVTLSKVIRSNSPVRNGQIQNNVFVLPGASR